MSPTSPEGRVFTITDPTADEVTQDLAEMLDAYQTYFLETTGEEDRVPDVYPNPGVMRAILSARQAIRQEERLSALSRELQAHYRGAHYLPAGLRRAR